MLSHLFAALILLFAAPVAFAQDYLLFAGSYTKPASPAGSKGIYGFRFDSKSGALKPLGLVAETSNPAHVWPSPDERFLYAVNWQAGDKEFGDSVSAFSIDHKTGQLTFLNRVNAHGDSPNQVVLDPSGRITLTVTFTGGTFSAFPVEANGRLGEAFFTNEHGPRPTPAGQPSPKTHGASFSKDGRYCFVAELGLDRVYSYRVDAVKPSLTPVDPPYAEVKPNTGPRRLQVHPTGKLLYVNLERTSQVSVFAVNEGRLQEIQTISTLPADFQGKNTTAEIQIDHTGRWLYVSNRGHDSLALYAVDPAQGTLKLVENIPSRGQTPRNLTIDPTNQFLFCANQTEGNIVTFRIDPANGHLTPVGEPVSVSQPGGMALVKVAAPPAAATKLDLGGVREEHVMVPMRDGKRLSVYLYFPPGDGKWPAVFEQRYADISSSGSRKNAAKFAESGFVVALVNFRGSHQSEGVWRGYRALQWGELRDGYDMCEWLAAQPWCTGKIGTYGGSQAGYAQNYLAVTQPPHLVAQYMTDTGLSLYQEGYRIGGVTRPMRIRAMGEVARDPADNEAWLREMEQHPDFDDYWRAEDASQHFGKMNLPCFTIGSWYDFMIQGSIASYLGRQNLGGENSRGRQQLILGPWLHGGYPKSNKIGDMLYPENAMFDVYAHMTKWFNHYLKGETNGVEKEAPVRYYVMGATGEPRAPGNIWREAKDFLPSADKSSLYLQSGGALTAEKQTDASAKTSYVSDPAAPMEIPGRSFPGAKDARPFEQQKEVRTWTTEALAEPQEWTGAVNAEIYVSSTARDTDFLLRVSDVYPDGRSILLMDYPLRARYREGFEKQVLLTPGEPALLKWRIGWTSMIFNKGHRIRVTIASTGAPLYEPNNQTGGPQTMDWMKDAISATNTIWHDQAHPSRLVIPLIKAAR